MDYEHRYKQAIEKIRNGLQPLSDGAKISGVTRAFLEEVFPELGESEDERIKETLIDYFKIYKKQEECGIKTFFGIPTDNIIAWLEKQGQEPKKVSIWKHWKNGIAGNGEDNPIYLIKTGYTYSLSSCLSFECDYIELSELDNLLLEKQGEKKATDKGEPKFKVGDWIIRSAEGFKHNAYHITEVKDYYVCEELKGRRVTFTFDDVRKNFKLWDISDAKDGDVLCVKYGNDEMPFIFTGKQDDVAYCALNSFGEFVLSIAEWLLKTTFVLPASKEQRDLLFQKMKEAGYGWDTEKKKLKKLTQSVTKISDQDAWSYEDEANLNNIIWLCNNCINGSETTWIPSQAKKIKHLIETIKERGLSQQKPTEWNEEDEENLQHCCGAVFAADYYTYEDKQDMEKWLLQLKERIGG